MSVFRHFENAVGEAFGEGLWYGLLCGLPVGAAIMFFALLIGGTLK